MDDVIEQLPSPSGYKIPVNHPQPVDLAALITGLGSTLGDSLRSSIQESMESSVNRLSSCVQEVLAASRHEEEIDQSYESDYNSGEYESDGYSSRSDSPPPRKRTTSCTSRHQSPSLVRYSDHVKNQVLANPSAVNIPQNIQQKLANSENQDDG